eukprot:scaffold94_cov340-Prasinococcus_capsulatus_cf.AAC.22
MRRMPATFHTVAASRLPIRLRGRYVSRPRRGGVGPLAVAEPSRAEPSRAEGRSSSGGGGGGGGGGAPPACGGDRQREHAAGGAAARAMTKTKQQRRAEEWAARGARPAHDDDDDDDADAARPGSIASRRHDFQLRELHRSLRFSREAARLDAGAAAAEEGIG